MADYDPNAPKNYAEYLKQLAAAKAKAEQQARTKQNMNNYFNGDASALAQAQAARAQDHQNLLERIKAAVGLGTDPNDPNNKKQQ